MKNLKLTITIFTTLISCATWGSDLTVPNSFVANQPAVAAQVNANFTAVETSVDDNNSRIDLLEALVADLVAVNNNLETRLANVEANTVLELDGYLSYAEFNGYPTAEFSGVNIQVNDGSNNTVGFVNGLGNIIIGYNEDSSIALEFCSDPQFTAEIPCGIAGETWAKNIHRGSHNLILGRGNSYDDYGSIISGENNVVNGTNTSIISGALNNVSGSYAITVGGNKNIASGIISALIGGRENEANVNYSTVSGGFKNIASGEYSSINGGQTNLASGNYSTVSGGLRNTALGNWSSVTGGDSNDANGDFSSISGGQSNSTEGEYSSISGGNSRVAPDIDDWVAGRLLEDF